MGRQMQQRPAPSHARMHRTILILSSVCLVMLMLFSLIGLWFVLARYGWS